MSTRYSLSFSNKETRNKCPRLFEIKNFYNQTRADKGLLVADEAITPENMHKKFYNLNAADRGHYYHDVVQLAFHCQALGMGWSETATALRKHNLYGPMTEERAPSKSHSHTELWVNFNKVLAYLPILLTRYELFDFKKWARTEEIHPHSPIELCLGLDGITEHADVVFDMHVDLILWDKVEHRPEVVDIKSTTIKSTVVIKQLTSLQILGYMAGIGYLLYTLNPAKYRQYFSNQGLTQWKVLFIEIDHKEPTVELASFGCDAVDIQDWVYGVTADAHDIARDMRILGHLQRNRNACSGEWGSACWSLPVCKLPLSDAMFTVMPLQARALEVASVYFDFHKAVALWSHGIEPNEEE